MLPEYLPAAGSNGCMLLCVMRALMLLTKV
jgi:hypothetical protein